MCDSFSNSSSIQHFEWRWNAKAANMSVFPHGDKAPIGFSDGHAESMGAKEVATNFKDVIGSSVTYHYYGSPSAGTETNITIN